MITINKINENCYHIMNGVKGIELSRNDYRFIKFAATVLIKELNKKEQYPLLKADTLKFYRVDTINQNAPEEIGMHFYIEDQTDFASLTNHDLTDYYHTLKQLLGNNKADFKKSQYTNDANLTSDGWSVTLRTAMYKNSLYPVHLSIYFVSLNEKTPNIELRFSPDDFPELLRILNE